MTMGKTYAGLFVGLSTVDIIYGVDSFPAPDTKTTAAGYCIAAGGPASNAAVAFAYLGGDARLVSALGTGVVAELARRDLSACGVAHLEIDEKRRADPALSAIVVSTAAGSRTIAWVAISVRIWSISFVVRPWSLRIFARNSTSRYSASS